jgi:hypothetical protein
MDIREAETQTAQEKKIKARQANARKQRRYRESMKAQGCRARLVWEKPLEAGWARMAAPVIRESTVDIAGRIPAIGEVLEGLYEAFIVECEKKGVPKEAWEPVYRDVRTLLKPLGIGEG